MIFKQKNQGDVLVGTFSAIWLSLLLPLLLLELQVTIMHYGPRELVDGDFLFRSEAQDVNGTLPGDMTGQRFRAEEINLF